jgi:hypothetical protein
MFKQPAPHDIRTAGRQIEDIEEHALYYRALCVEYATAAKHPEIVATMLRLADQWEKFAANVRRDVEAITSSWLLIAEADQLLGRKQAPVAPEVLREGVAGSHGNGGLPDAAGPSKVTNRFSRRRL